MSRARLAAVGLTLGVILTSCAAETDTGQAQGEGTDGAQVAAGEPSGDPTHGGSITVALEAETVGWAPWQDSWANSGSLVSTAFYDRLGGRDEDGQVRPVLAESITPNDDFTEYTLVLRDGIEFHDGEPLDADALALNIAKHREPGSTTSAVVAPIEEVIVEDDLTVRFELNQPHVAFADAFVGAAGAMVSPASIEAETASREPVGTGPFVFESWQRDQQLVVSRNEDYWREDLPYLDEIVFRPIPDEEARLQSLFSDDVQMLQSLRQSIVAQAREHQDELNLYEHLGNNSGGAIYNTARPPTDDVRVRRAIAHAINQDDIIEVLGGTGITPPDHPTRARAVHARLAVVRRGDRRRLAERGSRSGPTALRRLRQRPRPLRRQGHGRAGRVHRRHPAGSQPAGDRGDLPGTAGPGRLRGRHPHGRAGGPHPAGRRRAAGVHRRLRRQVLAAGPGGRPRLDGQLVLAGLAHELHQHREPAAHRPDARGASHPGLRGPA